MMGTPTVPLNVTCGAVCIVVGRLWMIRYIENGLGRDGTHQNMRERRLWMRDTNFLGKNEGAVGVRKTTIFY
jgi:hypothetical protein